MVQMSFKVTGFITPVYAWRMNGNCALEHGFDAAIVERDRVTVNDAGRYECTVTDMYTRQEMKRTFQVQVPGQSYAMNRSIQTKDAFVFSRGRGRWR